jgi:tetratricopeptide (TPR) repeat protein
MTAKWLPVEGGIVPLGDASGPTQEEERFAALQRALEDARGEQRLRRLDAAESILGTVIPTAESLPDHRYSLLAASACSLQGRIHWRRAERALEYQDDALAEVERAKQDEAFRKAIELFRTNERFITADMPESRLCTDYAIALFRTKDTQAAIRMLQRAQATGVMAADAFAYLGMAYRERGEREPATVALKKGLQLAPGDKVLLETLALTLEDAGKNEEALRTYCKAATAAGKDDDLASAQRLLRAALKIRQDDAQALSMLTLLLHSQKNDTAAKELLDATLEKFPNNPWALGLRAMILRDQGNTDAALSDFSRARVDSADLAWVSLEHAKTLVAKDPSTARKLLKQVSRLLGEDDARVVQARVQLQVQIAVSSVAGIGRTAADWLRAAANMATKSQLVRRVIELGPMVLLNRLDEFAKSESEQVALLKEIIDRWPGRVEPREALANLRLRQGNHAEALAEVDRALAVAPDSASLLGLKAKALDSKGDLVEAVRFYRRASRAAWEDEDVFDALIDALTRAGRSEEALGELEHRLALFPKNGRALAAKGRLLYEAGRLEDAVETLQAAEPLVPDDSRLTVRIRLAQALRSLDQYGESLRELERAAEIDNALGDAHLLKAAILIEIAEYEQAATVLERAIGRIPAGTSDDGEKRQLGWLWSARGWALRRTGKTPVDQLKEMFERATTLAPDDPYAKKNLAWALLQKPVTKEQGERLIRELIDERADIPKEMVGECHFMLEQHEVAEHWLRGVVNGDPTDIATRFVLALVRLAMRRDDDAKEYAAASKLARQKSAERRRGLFHLALGDLIDAHKEGRVDPAQAKRVWQDLWKDLQAAGERDDELARLQYRVAEENAA